MLMMAESEIDAPARGHEQDEKTRMIPGGLLRLKPPQNDLRA